MGPLVGLLIFVAIAVVWAFFNFQPQWANKQTLSTFNWSVVGAGLMICLAFYFNLHVLFSAPMVLKYRKMVTIAGCLGIESAWLLLMFLLRNFWIFKPPKVGRR